MIESYLTDTIDIKTPAFDLNGVQTGAPVQPGVKARIEDKTSIVRDLQGREVSSSCFLLIDPAATVGFDSLVYLKTQNGTARPDAAKGYAAKKIGRGHGFGFEFWRVWL
jgi:hypothetical protein